MFYVENKETVGGAVGAVVSRLRTTRKRFEREMPQNIARRIKFGQKRDPYFLEEGG